MRYLLLKLYFLLGGEISPKSNFLPNTAKKRKWLSDQFRIMDDGFKHYYISRLVALETEMAEATKERHDEYKYRRAELLYLKERMEAEYKSEESEKLREDRKKGLQNR